MTRQRRGPWSRVWARHFAKPYRCGAPPPPGPASHAPPLPWPPSSPPSLEALTVRDVGAGARSASLVRLSRTGDDAALVLGHYLLGLFVDTWVWLLLVWLGDDDMQRRRSGEADAPDGVLIAVLKWVYEAMVHFLDVFVGDGEYGYASAGGADEEYWSEWNEHLREEARRARAEENARRQRQRFKENYYSSVSPSGGRTRGRVGDPVGEPHVLVVVSLTQ